MLPSFNEHGFLPPGIHDCTLEEIEARFGFDVLLARAETDEVSETAEFYQQTRSHPHLRKGILRLRL